ncbi:hypothetical protein H1R20_g11678, partial [Candolleomyces eurysporus]
MLQTLGEGEFGRVKLGLHSQWGEEVAIKLIRRGNSTTDMSKVEREIEVLRSLKHPNIVRLYDVIETDKYIGVVQEYASGGELFDHILAHRYLSEKHATKLFSQLISGVWYIHQRKIIHRDLRLENLLLDRHRNVIITGFDFANNFGHRKDDLMQTSCGSPYYAAPELVISEGPYVGSAVDIWSCGVILYSMLAGYLPFDDDPANPDGDNINLLYKYIINTALSFPAYVSAEARDLLSLMLVPDPTRRATLDTVMDHPWLAAYHGTPRTDGVPAAFGKSVAHLEQIEFEQRQQKRMSYRKQINPTTAVTNFAGAPSPRGQSFQPEPSSFQLPDSLSSPPTYHSVTSHASPPYGFSTEAHELSSITDPLSSKAQDGVVESSFGASSTVVSPTLGRVTNNLLESEFAPDQTADPIWLMGVQHPGFKQPSGSSPSHIASTTSSIGTSGNRSSLGSIWPQEFYSDFGSLIWLTYRSNFPSPLKDEKLEDLPDIKSGQFDGGTKIPSTKPRWKSGETGLSSDSGLGCMIRTGQSLLANALIHVQLGRDWRKPSHPVLTSRYATYVQILTWFLDTPEAPFSIHRMALAGKELGVPVGQWFGPSVAAGALKMLVDDYPLAGIGIAIAAGHGVVYQTDVYAASHASPLETGSNKSPRTWGDRPVLVLIDTKLGSWNVSIRPICDTLKALFTFPQSVGIANGRPSSSYHFVASQADELFYLDPHFSRPSIPLRPLQITAGDERNNSVEVDWDRDRGIETLEAGRSGQEIPFKQDGEQPTKSTGSSDLRHQFGPHELEESTLDAVELHYCTAYTAAELQTFHCDRVRKMPLSKLDPSMLIGLLCKNEEDWMDVKRRVAELPSAIFMIQDGPSS